jgi:hypothetical protein
MFFALWLPMLTLRPGWLGWLAALWLIWAALLWGGFLLGKPNADGGRRMPTWSRLASSGVLVLAAWSWYLAGGGNPAVMLTLWVAVGMSLGFIGDLFMARLLPLRLPAIGGMAAFGLGHIAYITGWLSWSNQVGLADPALRWGALAAWLLVGALGWYRAVYHGGRPSRLHWAALPYALLLAGTAGVASGLALQYPPLLLLALGAALFLLSDLIIAARLFRKLHFRLVDDVVWLTYGPAQMLLVYSVGLALYR